MAEALVNTALGALAAKGTQASPGMLNGLANLVGKLGQNAQRRREFRAPMRAARRKRRIARRANRPSRQSRRVRAPAAVGTVSMTKAPGVGGSGSRPLVVSHREYIYSVESSQALNSWTFPIQPGDPVTMPWASHMTNLYERYRIRSMNFEYEPNCASTTVGTVIISPSYDANDAAPATFEEATSKMGAVHGQVWTPMSCTLDPNRIHGQMQRLSCRKGTEADTDIKTYDGGNVHLCVVDCADDGTLIGRLGVNYELELHTPVGATESYLDLISSANSGLTGADPLPDLSDDSGEYGDLYFDATGGKNYWRVPGEYLVIVRVTGTVMSSWTHANCGGEWNSIYANFDTGGESGWMAAACRVQAGDILDIRLTATTVTLCTIIITNFRYDDADEW